MRKKNFVFLTSLIMGASSLLAKDIGAVNFAQCMTDSKQGKKEQESCDNLRSQMNSLVENTNKELEEIAAKFEDTEYLDSLSPKAEEELRMKRQGLEEEMMRYQNQFSQVLNQANYQMMQKVHGVILASAEKIAKEKKLDYVLNKDACFYINPDLDITNLVIQDMDIDFDLKEKAKQNLSENSEPEAAIELTDSQG